MTPTGSNARRVRLIFGALLLVMVLSMMSWRRYRVRWRAG